MGRLALLVTFLGLLATAPGIPLAGSAWARTHPEVPGPEPTNGDPTGDDVPNPTPKANSRSAATIRVRDRDGVVREERLIGGTLEAWKLALRHLVWISLR